MFSTRFIYAMKQAGTTGCTLLFSKKAGVGLGVTTRHKE